MKIILSLIVAFALSTHVSAKGPKPKPDPPGDPDDPPADSCTAMQTIKV